MANTRVLVVEDDLWWGDILVGALKSRGYEVTYFCRASLVGENGANLMDPDGKVSPLRVEEFDIALIDGRLKGSNINGWDLTPRVVAAGLPVIGISGDQGLNRLMVEAGATHAMTKLDIWTGLRENRVNLAR